jgi:solute carrier family 13 (sodium-dependent dicarboxylate transporter), member 2/3/5
MPKTNHLKTAAFFLGALLFCLTFWFEIEGLNLAGRITLGIFLMAAIFWIFEPLPIYATSLLVIFLQVLFLSDQGFINFDGVSDYKVESYKTFYATLSSPIIILFLGGFSLATAAVKFGLDRRLTRFLIRPFGKKPANVCLGMMLSTALLSAFMSNTATTAMMMTMVVPVLLCLKKDDPFKTGITLSIPVAANIGGIATPIGTPPNAIVISALRDQDVIITFSTWMLLVPLVIIMLFIAWRIILILFPPQGEVVEVQFSDKFDWSKDAKMATAIFAITILLWVTEKLHGISSNIVAFLPIALLPSLGVLKTVDIRRFSWEVLWLVAGGISLGISLQSTGLASWLIGLVPWTSLGALTMIIIFALVAYGLANLISNTVTATILIPLIIGLGTSGLISRQFPIAVASVLVGVMVSFSMMLPISTPPNAIAMSSGQVKTSDMAKVGFLVGICALFLCCLSYFVYWPMFLKP